MKIVEKIKQRAPSLPTTILILVLAASGVSLFWSVNTLKAVSIEKDALSSDLSRLTKLEETIFRGEKVLDALDSSQNTVNRNMPDSMDFQSFYGELTALTREHNIEVSKIEPKETETTEQYSLMAITVNAESSFREFFEFTRDLSATQRLVTMERTDVRSLVDGERCSFEITINIYSTEKSGENDA